MIDASADGGYRQTVQVVFSGYSKDALIASPQKLWLVSGPI
jgi:hypothetical protein